MSLGIPWQCRGWDATISLPRLQLQSLAGELRSCKLWSTVTNKQIPLVIEFWVLPDNSEVHLKFLKLITTAKTSLTNKLSARGSGGEAVDMSLGPPFKPPQASTESPFCPSLPCPPRPCVLESRFSLQGRQPQMLPLLQTSGTEGHSEGPHLSGCENLGKSPPLLGGAEEGEGSCRLKELC